MRPFVANFVDGPGNLGISTKFPTKFPRIKTQAARDSQSYLYPASQLGLALYMFVVGMEFRVDIVQQRMKSSMAVSAAGILVPLISGAGLAWLLFQYTNLQAWGNIGGGAAYVAVALLVVRPLLARARQKLPMDGAVTEAGMVTMLALMALGAWFTDLIGLHAVFGAFLVGAAMPRGPITRDLITRIQPLTVALLLPLFFTSEKACLAGILKSDKSK